MRIILHRGHVLNSEEVYRRYLQGEEEAIGEIVREYNKGLVLYATSMLGNWADAEDAVQETFVKVALRDRVYSGRGTFKAWLYTVTKNCCIDRLRHRRTLLQTVDISDEEWESLRGLASEEPEEAYMVEETKENLRELIKQLPPEQYDVMYLYAFEEFTPEEIAKILGIPRRRVYSLIGEARKELGRADHEKI